MLQINKNVNVVTFIAEEKAIILCSPTFSSLNIKKNDDNLYVLEIEEEYMEVVKNLITRNDGKIVKIEKYKYLYFDKCDKEPIENLFFEYCISEKIFSKNDFCIVQISGNCLSVEILLQKNGFEPLKIIEPVRII